MDLIRVVITAFHTGDDGEIQLGPRLDPARKRRNAGGHSTFRELLHRAATLEGLDVVTDKRRREPHRGRATG